MTGFEGIRYSYTQYTPASTYGNYHTFDVWAPISANFRQWGGGLEGS